MIYEQPNVTRNACYLISSLDYGLSPITLSNADK